MSACKILSCDVLNKTVHAPAVHMELTKKHNNIHHKLSSVLLEETKIPYFTDCFGLHNEERSLEGLLLFVDLYMTH